jgi:aspartate/methionine/tyrosine aminotransferase
MREVLARRVAGFGTTIFTEMSALAVQHNAINLGQGFPDFAGPAFIKNAATTAINNDLNQYPPMAGLPRLRQLIATQWSQLSGREVDWQSEVTITSGATEALFDLAAALIDPGDLVLIIEPAYDSYIPGITMAGGVPLVVQLQPPTTTQPHWSLDEAELRAAFAQRPKYILLNTPHNPTGKVFTRAELALIATLCQEYDVLAIADEVYDQMVYDAANHISLATLPGMWERTLTLNSTGKTFSVTGWKVGWAVGGAKLNHALRQAHQWVTFTTATPLQDATATALELAATNGYYDDLRREYDQRRAMLCTILEQVGLPVLATEGSYFVNSSIERFGFSDDRGFCRWLTTEIGVAAIPTSVFYSTPTDVPQLARFCFAKKFTTLEQAGERLQRLRER